MQTAKTALGITKYFVSLPSAKQLAALILLIPMLAGALLAVIESKRLDIAEIVAGAGSALFIISIPSFIAALSLAALRRRVQPARALALGLLSSIAYLFFYFLAMILRPIVPAAFNIIFIGFGIAFLLWLAILKFAFGLERSAWLFALAQSAGYAIFLLAGSSLYAGAIDDLLLRVGLSAAVFTAALYALLSLASGPLKKNLGLKSADILSGFSSQWLYGEKDLEEAFDEIGEEVVTYVAVAKFETRHGALQWIVPYVHFGPFGNLGGSQFSSQIPLQLNEEGVQNFVFHSTCTHDFDPVSSSQIKHIVEAVRKISKRLKPMPASYCIKNAQVGSSRCHLLEIKDYMIASFSRAPLSTEDINFAIGWGLMGQMEAKASKSIVIDCHNAETGDVDYVEPGSEIAFEMSDALDEAMKKNAKKQKMLAGWACNRAEGIESIGDAGVMVTCISSLSQNPAFFILIDSNGITSDARERLILAVKKNFENASFVEIFTTDTHQLNSVRGVFNPAGAQCLQELEKAVVEACKKAWENLAPASFDMGKERIKIKVLGPYQSAEIVATINSVVAILKVALPLALIAAAALLLIIFARM
jgi:putative membrane protein